MERDLYIPFALVWLIGSIAFSCIACLTWSQKGTRSGFSTSIFILLYLQIQRGLKHGLSGMWNLLQADLPDQTQDLLPLSQNNLPQLLFQRQKISAPESDCLPTVWRCLQLKSVKALYEVLVRNPFRWESIGLGSGNELIELGVDEQVQQILVDVFVFGFKSQDIQSPFCRHWFFEGRSQAVKAS